MQYVRRLTNAVANPKRSWIEEGGGGKRTPALSGSTVMLILQSALLNQHRLQGRNTCQRALSPRLAVSLADPLRNNAHGEFHQIIIEIE